MNGNLYVDIIIHIFELESSTLVSDWYVLMQRILYLICLTPYFKFTIPLVKNRLLQMGPYISFHIFIQCGYL